MVGNNGLSIFGTDMSVLLPGNHREKVYPWDTVGASISAGNGAWSPPIPTVPVDAIVDDVGHGDSGSTLTWNFLGIYGQVITTAAKEVTWQMFRIVKTSETALNADSGVSEGDDSKIYIADTSGFLVDDYVWVKDDNTTDGELQIVSVIDTNVSLDTTTSMAADYTTAQNAKCYLVWRGGAGNDQYRAIWGKIMASSAREHSKDTHHAARVMEAGDGLLARAYGTDSATVTIAITVLYDDWS